MDHPVTGEPLGEVRGDVIMFAEWYGTSGKPNEGQRLTATEFAEGCRRREQKMGLWRRIKPGPADHNIFGDGSNGPSEHRAMMKKKIRFDKVKKGQGSRKLGWQIVRDRLVGALPPDDGHFEMMRQDPGFFIFDECKYFIELFPPTPRSEKDPDDVDGEYEDHIADMTSYRLRKQNRAFLQRGF